MFAMPALKFLDLSHNLLGSSRDSYLSEAIGQAQTLVELHLAGNQLDQLPESIGDLSNLEVLNLKDNKLRSLPHRFGMLEKLFKLNLDGNQLTVVQATLGSLTLLRDLSIGCNKLQSVQEDCLCNLSNLVMLDLHQNQLRDFSAVPKAPKLDTISLSYN